MFELFNNKIKITGKQRIMMILSDGESHHALEFIRLKFHKFSSRISEINKEFPGLIEIVKVNGHYKCYKLRY